MFGVVQQGRRLRLAPEPPQGGLLAEDSPEHDLHCHLPPQPQVARRVDRAHSSLADQLLQAVLFVDGARHRQRESQRTPVAIARFLAAVEAGAANRALLE
jgi:hypothetical protein